MGKGKWVDDTLGSGNKGMENDVTQLGFRGVFNNISGSGGEKLGRPSSGSKRAYVDESEDLLGLITDGERRYSATGGSGSGGGQVGVNLNLGLGGESSSSMASTFLRVRENCGSKRVYVNKSEDLLGLITDIERRCSATGGSGSSGVKDVNLDLGLGLGGEQLPSSLSTTFGMARENCTKNKRPKHVLFSLDWPTISKNEICYVPPVQKEVGFENVLESGVAKSNSEISYTGVEIDDFCLPDDILHTVFSFLGHIDICRLARVCKQWREASSHADFWRCLDFENRTIPMQQFEAICERYPKVSEVNVCTYPLALRAVSSLRNLETLTLGKCQLGETFFQALTDCLTLNKLIINDASLGDAPLEISLCHDRLIELHIMKCRVFRITIRCPQLETLSLKRSSMPFAAINCPLVQKLDIASCRKLSDLSIRSAVTSCPLLESLDMSDCSCVSDETLREIAAACGNLHVLDASYCPNISLDGVRLPVLVVLKLHSCDDISTASMGAIAFSDMLEILELDNCNYLTSVSLELPCLKNISLVHCRKLVDLNLQCSVLSSITVSNCPSLEVICITSNALKKLVLQKLERMNSLALQCPYLQDVDLSECESLTNSICEVFASGRGCPVVRSLVLDSCESLTAVSFCSTSLVSLSLGGCSAITHLELQCPYLKHISLHGCDHLERASFSPVGLRTLNLGICPQLDVLHIEAPLMFSLELKGCGVLSEAFIYCPLLTSLDASFCSQLKDDCLSSTSSNCPFIESLVLMSCPSVGPDGLSSLLCLSNLTYLDLSYTFLVDLQPVFCSCLNLKVLKLQACKYLGDTALEPLYKGGALPDLCELDLSYGTLSQSSIEELLSGCMGLTHISLNGCVNLHDLDWGSYNDMLPEISTSYGSVSHCCSRSVLPKDQSNSLLQNLNCVGCPNIKKVVIPATIRCFRLSSLNLSLSSNLREVDVSCCNLLLLNLSNCYSLQVLKLDCPRLTSLFLQSCNVDKEVVKTAIVQCYMLETLDVRFCPKISPLSTGIFRKACPSLRRIFSGLAPI